MLNIIFAVLSAIRNVNALQTIVKVTSELETKYSGLLTLDFSYTEQETIGDIFNKIKYDLEKAFQPVQFKIDAPYEGSIFGKQLKSQRLSVTSFTKEDILFQGLHIRAEPHFFHQHNQALVGAGRCRRNVSITQPRARSLSRHITDTEPFVLHRISRHIAGIYQPTYLDRKEYKFNSTYGYLAALVKEVIHNEPKKYSCVDSEHCKYCDSNTGKCNLISPWYFLMKRAKLKLKAQRHRIIGSPLRIDEMLAILLYTESEYTHHMCKAQRSDDYATWKWLDYLLQSAIQKLSERESGDFPAFSGVDAVQMDVTEDEGYFPTYVSTSRSESQASRFIINNNSMMLHFDPSFKDDRHNKWADISWISKFRVEDEVLFARSTSVLGRIYFSQMGVSNGVQHICVQRIDPCLDLSSVFD